MLTQLTIHRHPVVDAILKALLAAGLMGSIGRFEIGTDTGVSITMQTLFVLLPAAWFGPLVGVLAVAAYITLGICGFSVFPGDETGIGKLIGPSGGFYFAFLIAAGALGYLQRIPKLQSYVWQLVLWAGAHAVILLFGFWWLWSVVWVPANTASFEHLQSAITPLIPGLFVKTALGVMLTNVVLRLLQRKAAR